MHVAHPSRMCFIYFSSKYLHRVLPSTWYSFHRYIRSAIKAAFKTRNKTFNLFICPCFFSLRIINSDLHNIFPCARYSFIDFIRPNKLLWITPQHVQRMLSYFATHSDDASESIIISLVFIFHNRWRMSGESSLHSWARSPCIKRLFRFRLE